MGSAMCREASMDQSLTWKDVRHLMGEARSVARRLLRHEGHAQSLPVTALVLTGLRRQKLADQEWADVTWDNRERFLAAMYRAMDRALTDHGRRRCARKRLALQRVALEEMLPDELLRTADLQPHELERSLDERPEVVEALTAALALLESTQPEWACVARHRYYGGLTVDDTARIMGLSERTVRRHWERARVLLHAEIVRLLQAQGAEL